MEIHFRVTAIALCLSVITLASAQNPSMVHEYTSQTVRTAFGTSATLSKKRAVIGMPESFMFAPLASLRASEQIPEAIHLGIHRIKAVGEVLEGANTSVRKMRLPTSVELATGTHNIITVPSAAVTQEIDAMTSETDERLQKVIERDRQIREELEGSIL